MVAQSLALRFDRSTGYPIEWSRSEATWCTWSSAWLALKWPRWAGHTPRSGVEVLVAITPYLVKRRAPEAPDDLRPWLWEISYRPDLPDSARSGPMFVWLDRWSIPLVDLTPDLLDVAIAAATTRQDGRQMAPTTSRRRRNSIKTVLDAAVRRGHLTINTMDHMEWRAPKRSIEVDISVVPSMAGVVALVDHVANGSEGARRYAAFFGCIGMAGMRPSEAAGLRVPDLDLPAECWGLARLRGALTTPGTRYRNDGSVSQAKSLKHRAASDIREVPLPPNLIRLLDRHLVDFPSDDLVFKNNAGNPISPHNYGKIWKRARSAVWPPPHPLANTVPHDLRHSCATALLAAGVNPAEISRRLGHSVDVLMKVYSGVFIDERAATNESLSAIGIFG